MNYDGHEQTWEQQFSAGLLQETFGELSNETNPEIWPKVAERINLGLRTLVPFVQPENNRGGGHSSLAV